MTARRKKLSPRRRRYARARARGETLAKAAKAAGYNSKRASLGVTGSEIEKDPRVAAEIQRLIQKAMPTDEMLALRAAQARGILPTKTTVDLGDGTRVECDRGDALSDLMRAAGLFKEPHVGPTGGPIVHEHRFADMTDDELKRRLAEKAAEAGVRVGRDA